jgi:hypothetical protein
VRNECRDHFSFLFCNFFFYKETYIITNDKLSNIAKIKIEGHYKFVSS